MEKRSLRADFFDLKTRSQVALTPEFLGGLSPPAQLVGPLTVCNFLLHHGQNFAKIKQNQFIINQIEKRLKLLLKQK
uniref:Uncharacterized protein n=1 Tax=Romanomermis culicivorax TaxID=13658 RepID=A0A915JK07_ROMCU